MTSRWGADRPSDPGLLLTEFLRDEAPPSEPSLLLPAVLARTALTRRRSAWRIGSWWSEATTGRRPLTYGSTTMSAALRVLAPVALVLAGGWYLVAVAPGPSWGSQALASPTPSPVAMTPSANLEAGTSYVMKEPFLAGSPRMVFTIPGAGWTSVGEYNVGKNVTNSSIVASYHDIAMTPWRPDDLVLDPCHWQTGGVFDPPVGPSVDDLATALVEQAAGNAAPPTDVEVGGYRGTRLELWIPDDLDIATCPGGDWGRWLEAGAKGGHTYGNRQRDVVYILDIEGIRGVIDTMYLPGVAEADLAELEALVASIRFEWPAPDPSASS